MSYKTETIWIVTKLVIDDWVFQCAMILHFARHNSPLQDVSHGGTWVFAV